jgi:murein DD-endopeptidase MepM/ murein hydrolase activator NlpD
MSTQKQNYYRILQVDPSAEPEVIDGAYRRLAKKYHPDTRETNEISSDRMQLINEAYEVLIDPGRRAQYDRQLQSELALPKDTPETHPVDVDNESLKSSTMPIKPGIVDVASGLVKALTGQPNTMRQYILKWAPSAAVAVTLMILAVVVVIVVRNRFFNIPKQIASQETMTAPAELSTSQSIDPRAIALAPIEPTSSVARGGIARFALLHTTIPTRPRVDVIKYTVEPGDTLFVIADKFSLKPETLLWGNYDVLEDNPHLLKPNQALNILPTDGTYYKWAENDILSKVAEFFKVDPKAILEYPGNRFDLTVSTVENPGVEVGKWLIIPGGKRAIKDWGPPAISRTNPASAAYYGPGSCGKIYEGAIGIGAFVWPTTERFISGYGYDPGVHPAIDIAGEIGNPVMAADSGVVVYAGWSNYGYGNLLVIDHGTGWQTAYGHLNSIGVTCGQSVLRGGVVATLGSTGNSTGAHLHFEMIYNGVKVNPRDFIQ